MAGCIRKAFRFVGNRLFNWRAEARDEPRAPAKKSKDSKANPDPNSRKTQRARRYSRLERLPFDIKALIFPHLPLVSQACLALTCKHFHKLLAPVYADPLLSWPRFLSVAPPCREAKFGCAPTLPRNDLLLKLEDARWLYCSSCLKLHPHTHFPKGAAMLPHWDRPCTKLPFGGVVDLCACVTLTHSNGVRLARWLETGIPGKDLHANIRRKFRCIVRNGDDGGGADGSALVHECVVKGHPGAFVAITTLVSINVDGHLVVTTQFGASWKTPRNDAGPGGYTYPSSHRGTGLIALCPHTKGVLLVRNPDDPYDPYDRCWPCAKSCYLRDMKIGTQLVTDTGRHTIVETERDLGPMRNDLTEDTWEWDNYERWQRASRVPANDLQN
ncbi:hypothetical protein BJY00DRAFT_318391 [Aspergillus carlsbadensis]|nr:hypothetical protein BJY00DRAFT_318391 [Aspergillus carlsbadensis]